MQQNDKAVLVYSTFPSLDVAERVGAHLVDKRLAACVNILPQMISIYRWDGRRNRDEEVVMIIKTRSSLSERVMSETRALHPYTTPALMVVPVEGGLAAYLDWLEAETTETT